MPARSAPGRDRGGRGPVRVAVVGAGRARNGTGPFVVRRLVEGGADVAAVSTTRPQTAAEAAAAVAALSGRPCRAFTSVADMLESADLDAVAVCSPASAHADHLRLALLHGLDTFCEKPLVDPSAPHGGLDEASQLVAGFADQGLVLHLNTQWTYALGHLRALYDLDELPRLQTLRVELEPPAKGGAAMVAEAAPHANSLLLALAPEGAAGGMRRSVSADGERMAVHFTWSATSSPARAADGAEVSYVFRWRSGQPRKASFEVNGMRVERTVDMTAGYEVGFRGNGRAVVGADPLADSVHGFLDAICARPPPSSAILRNLELMVDIAGELETPPAATPGPVRAGLASEAG